MAAITLLDQSTINQIAAGEVIDRPSSVVKELTENAIDAGATAVTVEIKEGGISFIRITDNGCGIPKEEIPLAFLRHSTSKITTVEDLLTVSSLGFRGEALSSVAAVAQVELITKTEAALTGIRYVIEGGEEKTLEDVGAPAGSTFVIRNLFYNTPARRKFLKSAQTEASYIAAIVERIALSHPEISFRLIVNNQNKLHTAGNHKLRDIIYTVYGREISAELLKIKREDGDIRLSGYIGKPLISRGNRSYENFFINGRYIKSGLITKAIENAYHGFVMQHKYPFTVIRLTIDPAELDVNVHPAKMELRFRDEEKIYNTVYETIVAVLSGKELIPTVTLEDPKTEKMPAAPAPVIKTRAPEPFESKRESAGQVREHSTYEPGSYEQLRRNPVMPQPALFEEKILTPEARAEYTFIGQLFNTYWLVQYQDRFLLIDQHAAHEKVLYERTMKNFSSKEHTCQQLHPPLILTLNAREEEIMIKYLPQFQALGFEMEPFGGKEYAVYGVPGNLFSIAKEDLLTDLLDSLSEDTGRQKARLIEEKVALMSCKAAVKGNNRLSAVEAELLIDELLTLENPYTCPHGRPTIISMTKYELEKKFKRC